MNLAFSAMQVALFDAVNVMTQERNRSQQTATSPTIEMDCRAPARELICVHNNVLCAHEFCEGGMHVIVRMCAIDAVVVNKSAHTTQPTRDAANTCIVASIWSSISAYGSPGECSINGAVGGPVDESVLIHILSFLPVCGKQNVCTRNSSSWAQRPPVRVLKKSALPLLSTL
jgi:hypothetical protein